MIEQSSTKGLRKPTTAKQKLEIHAETWRRKELETSFTGSFGRSMETRLHYRPRLEDLDSFAHLKSNFSAGASPCL